GIPVDVVARARPAVILITPSGRERGASARRHAGSDRSLRSARPGHGVERRRALRVSVAPSGWKRRSLRATAESGDTWDVVAGSWATRRPGPVHRPSAVTWVMASRAVAGRANR